MNKQELIDEVQKNFKNIDSKWIDNIEVYRKFLTEYNKKVNLTRLDDESKIYGLYFYESIIPYKDIDFSKIDSVLDIGSGSGIPGVVLKILFPHIHLGIIESNNKKVTFLKELTNKLQLNNVDIFLKRAEDIKEDEYESYDLVTSRAVGKLKPMLEVSTPYAKVKGLIIIPKSQNYQQETNGLYHLNKRLDVEQKMNEFISKNGIQHNVFVFKKTHKTNRIYPRPWSKITKEN